MNTKTTAAKKAPAKKAPAKKAPAKKAPAKKAPAKKAPAKKAPEAKTPRVLIKDIMLANIHIRSKAAGPVAYCHALYSEIKKTGATRSRDYVLVAVENGVNWHTATTQYRAWQDPDGYAAAQKRQREARKAKAAAKKA